MIRDWLKVSGTLPPVAHDAPQVVRDVQLQKLEWFEMLSSHLLEGDASPPPPPHSLLPS
jgi:hypothetical protein